MQVVTDILCNICTFSLYHVLFKLICTCNMQVIHNEITMCDMVISYYIIIMITVHVTVDNVSVTYNVRIIDG